jgi:hypothetical protein
VVEISLADSGRRFFGQTVPCSKTCADAESNGGAKNSDRHRLGKARLCVISGCKAGFTGPALLSIANSGQMVLKRHDKIESHSLILVNCFPLKLADAVK